MTIAIAADPFAYTLKETLIRHLAQRGETVIDADGSTNLPYWEAAERACRAIADGRAERALLLCGTGAGMAIVANKFPGIAAVCVESVYAAGCASAINQANVLTMGAMIVGEAMAQAMADAWLDTPFADKLENLRDFLSEAAESVAEIDRSTRR